MMLDHWKVLSWKFINAMRIFVFPLDLPDGSSSSSFLADMGVLTRNDNGNYSLESWLLLVINLESYMSEMWSEKFGNFISKISFSKSYT